MSQLPIKTIYCKRSGMALASLTVYCTGGWPVISQLDQTIVHPIYASPLSVILNKMKTLIDEADEAAWMLSDHALQELALHMSATMYQLDAIWQPPTEALNLWHKLEPSLPNASVVASGASRLFKLARWYHFSTSKRMDLPLYRVSKANNNLAWENFSHWLDDAFSVRSEWETGRTELERQHQLRLHTEALHMIRSADVYKKIDFRKVWGWVDLQMKADSRYPAGRRETFREVFMTADTRPELWILDDIEDLQMAIMETCDRENDVYFFINQRIMNIKSCIKSFYGSFTLLTEGVGDSAEKPSEHEQAATGAFFKEYDDQIANLQTLPPEPQRGQYATLGKFMQAQAQWNILKRRFDVRAQQAKGQQGEQS